MVIDAHVMLEPVAAKAHVQGESVTTDELKTQVVQWFVENSCCTPQIAGAVVGNSHAPPVKV